MNKIANLYCLVFSGVAFFSNIVAMNEAKHGARDLSRCYNKTLLELVQEKQLSLPDMQNAITFFGSSIVHHCCHETGNTPLHYLLLRDDVLLEHIELLIEHGASLCIKNKCKETAIDCCFNHKGESPLEEHEDYKLNATYYKFLGCYVAKKLFLLQK